MEAVKTIREEHLETNHKYPYFIFTTAYDEYAVEAFELDAVDYLLKPYDAERFRESIARLRKHMQTQPDAPSPAPVPKLLIEHHEKLVVLNPESIYYAVRSDRMIEIHTEKDTIETKMSLQELEKKLTGHPFFRPHRSFLVNLNCIREIIPWFNGAYNLILKDKQQSKIPVSRSAAKSLFERLRKS